MKKIAVVSLHFSPGFIEHMRAWYEMCEQCGYSALLYFDARYSDYFRDAKYRFCTDIKALEEYGPEYAVVQNTGFENVPFFQWCGRNGCKVFYILHEPYMGFRELLKDGTYCVRQAAACLLNVWLCGRSEKVIVCSDYAEENCRTYMRGAYRKCVRFPLIFTDRCEPARDGERKYFSLIGTYAGAKGSDLFLKFIKDSAAKGYDIDFQIATRSDLSAQLKDGVLQKLMADGKLVVRHGRTMTTEEINQAYRRSVCCWNGYRRTTQSGVLPNAYMMGAPVAATRLGSFTEFVVPGETGEFIDNEDTESIYAAYQKISGSGELMSEHCRRYFLDHFYFGSQAERFQKIIDG